MSQNKRRKICIDDSKLLALLNKSARDDDKLFALLDLDPYQDGHMKQFDGTAIIENVQRNPQVASVAHKFSDNKVYYPLHKAVMLGDSVSVVEAVYNSYTPAIEAICQGKTALHMALYCDKPTEIVLFLLSKWPGATRQQDRVGNNPLHVACFHGASNEVLSSLIHALPSAAMEKNKGGMLPFHCALQGRIPPIETLSLLLKHYPGALKEKDINGKSSLHFVMQHFDVRLDVLLFICKKWPEAMVQKDKEEKTPLDEYDRYHASGRDEMSDVVRQAIFYVQQLYSGKELKNDVRKAMMKFFIDVKQGNEILLLIDRYPTLLTDFDIDYKIIPDLFSLLGQRCSMKTLWKAIRDEVDIMEGV